MASRINRNRCFCTTAKVCDPCSGRVVVKEINRMAGVSTAVIDDANELTYFYGNIEHENFHKPAAECQPYVVVPTNWQTYSHLHAKTEVFEGEFPNDEILLTKTPSKIRNHYIFLNGLHQDEGQEFDYLLEGNKIRFLNHTLIPTDRVTVKYHWEGTKY